MLSNPKFHQKNLEFVIEMLLNNDYPLTFIFKTINNRLKSLMTKKQNCLDSPSANTPIVRNDDLYFTMPYAVNFSDKFKYITKEIGVKMSYTGMNKLNRFIRVHKDRLERGRLSNVVYRISCRDCDASYVGQTRRLLITRINEHKNHMSRNAAQRSVITDHRLLNHEFKWEEVEVLDSERNLNKRLTSEIIFIKKQKNALNLQSDTENLHEAYLPVLESL